MAKDSNSSAPISEESIGYLEEVKKGKPRKFAMICKGTSVVSLVVYKKGNVEKRKKEAKESGKGQFYFGVIDGKGTDMRFVLARSDGFESEPVKTSVLKSFLDEAGGLKCKPRFEILDAPPLALDEDDPLVARFLKLQAAALQACTSHPDKASEINTLCRQIGSYLDQDQPDQATERLESLQTLLESLTAAPQVSSSTSDVPAADPMALWKAKVAELGPAIKAAIAAKGPNVAEMVKLLSQASAQSKPGGDVGAAITKLTECYALISQDSAADPAALFNERLKALVPEIRKAIGTPAGDEAKLRASEAGVFARKKEFLQANQLLDSVAELLKGAGSSASSSLPAADTPTSTPTPTPTPTSATKPEVTAGLVKYRTALLNYRSERQKVLTQLEDLYKAVVEVLPDKAEMTQELRDRLEFTFAEIDDAIDQAMSTAENEREPYNDKTRALMKTFAKSLASDKIIAQVDANPFVTVSVASMLVSALDRIEKSMV